MVRNILLLLILNTLLGKDTTTKTTHYELFVLNYSCLKLSLVNLIDMNTQIPQL